MLLLNVLDKNSIEAFIDSVVNKSGRLDISFCVTSTQVPGGEQGAAFSELSYEAFSLPIIDYTKAQFSLRMRLRSMWSGRDRG